MRYTNANDCLTFISRSRFLPRLPFSSSKNLLHYDQSTLGEHQSNIALVIANINAFKVENILPSGRKL